MPGKGEADGNFAKEKKEASSEADSAHWEAGVQKMRLCLIQCRKPQPIRAAHCPYMHKMPKKNRDR